MVGALWGLIQACAGAVKKASSLVKINAFPTNVVRPKNTKNGTLRCRIVNWLLEDINAYCCTMYSCCMCDDIQYPV